MLKVFLKLKKNSFNIFFFLLLAFLLITAVQAATLKDWDTTLDKTQGQTGYSKTNPENILGEIIKITIGMLGVVFLCFIVYGGILWMTARGNSEQLTKARQIISNSSVGLAIVLAAYAITYFLVNSLTNSAGYLK